MLMPMSIPQTPLHARFARPPRTIVVKIGSAVIAETGTLDPSRVAQLAADACEMLEGERHRRLVIVSSGAVASGYRALGLSRPPKEIVEKQAAAAVGQPRLMSAWAEAFAAARGSAEKARRTVAQVLLTAEDIDHRTRFLNARRTLEALLEAGVVPIINENDSVSYAEIKLGDNDRLSSLVASLVDADLLVILSSVQGVWAGKPPRGGTARIVPEVRTLADGLKLVQAETTSVGTGGMETKIRAACAAASLGIGVVIASGAEPNVLARIARGEGIGTYFPPVASSRAARKRWIGFSARPKGLLRVDEGAQRALVSKGASLLPSGLAAVDGNFAAGTLVEISGPDGRVFARGLSSYDSGELERIRGRKGREIAGVLGYCYAEEVVHRDDLALLDEHDATSRPRKA
jgi:glutamate 5-kinase